MARPRVADDFAAIRERIEELRRERGQWTWDHSAEPIDVDRRPINRHAIPLANRNLDAFAGVGRLGDLVRYR